MGSSISSSPRSRRSRDFHHEKKPALVKGYHQGFKLTSTTSRIIKQANNNMSLQATAMPLTTTTTDSIPSTTNKNEPTTKQQLEASTTSGMEGEGSSSSSETKERNVTAFHQIVWPILEKEGGWTLVRIEPSLLYILLLDFL